MQLVELEKFKLTNALGKFGWNQIAICTKNFFSSIQIIVFMTRVGDYYVMFDNGIFGITTEIRAIK